MRYTCRPCAWGQVQKLLHSYPVLPLFPGVAEAATAGVMDAGLYPAHAPQRAFHRALEHALNMA